jgi:predicted Fe-Mo cluster-binding NifX family protein
MASDKTAFLGKALLTVQNDMIAPRFDLATEVLIVKAGANGFVVPARSLLLPGPSVDELCALILRENIAALVCGGIENENYQFLVWKKVKVYDRVIGGVHDVMKRLLAGELRAGMIAPTSGARG